jgi:hypothetical protein
VSVGVVIVRLVPTVKGARSAVELAFVAHCLDELETRSLALNNVVRGLWVRFRKKGAVEA